MFPLALLNASSPPVLPTGILLFNGTNGATTTVNSGTIGTATLFGGAALSAAQAFEGVSSCFLPTGASKYITYTPTASGGNNNLVSKDFYISVAFRLDTLAGSEKRLVLAQTLGGLLLFRAYVATDGTVGCIIRQASGTSNTVVVPTLVCTTNTWYKLELIRNSATGQFTVKVGSDSVSQAVGNFDNGIGGVLIGSNWPSDATGYIDRFIYQPDSIVPY